MTRRSGTSSLLSEDNGSNSSNEDDTHLKVGWKRVRWSPHTGSAVTEGLWWGQTHSGIWGWRPQSITTHGCGHNGSCSQSHRRVWPSRKFREGKLWEICLWHETRWSSDWSERGLSARWERRKSFSCEGVRFIFTDRCGICIIGSWKLSVEAWHTATVSG